MKKLLTLLAVVLALTAIAGIALAADVPEFSYVAWGELDSVTTIAGHEVDPAARIEVQKKTCSQKGIYYYPCVTEGEPFYHVVYVEAGHVWSSESGTLEWGNIIEEPTCTSTGTAIDVCVVCGITRDKTRVIEKTAHKYDEVDHDPAIAHPTLPAPTKWYGYFKLFDDKCHYEVVTAPTCVTGGDAYRTCIYCGTPDKSALVSLRLLPHAWTEWKVLVQPTCKLEGSAIRVCAACGKTEKLTDTKENHAKWLELVSVRNPGWGTYEAIQANPLNKPFWTFKDPTKVAEWERLRSEDWLTTCYTKQDVYICPYCKCDPKLGVHKKIIVGGDLVSHIWKTTPEDTEACTLGIHDSTWAKATADARLTQALTDGKSIAPTCLYDGYAVFKCIYDGKETSSWPIKHSDTEPTVRYKVVAIPALGHTWGDWTLAETFKLKGEDVYQWVRVCKTCKVSESKVTFDPEGEKIETAILESIDLSKTKMTLKVGQEKKLKVKVLPANVKTVVTWKSSKKSVAAVHSDGTVVAKKKGKATISCTAVTLDGTYSLTATCVVTVKK